MASNFSSCLKPVVSIFYLAPFFFVEVVPWDILYIAFSQSYYGYGANLHQALSSLRRLGSGALEAVWRRGGGGSAARRSYSATIVASILQ